MSELSRFTENILDSLSEGVITVDKNLKINYFNPAAERITGHGRAEVLGKFCKNICASEACHDRCPIAAVLQQGKPLYDFHTTFTHASGKKLPVKLNASIVKNAEGDPIGGTLTFRDLSALEMIHQQLFHESQFFGMVGHNKTMHEIFDLINEIADSPASVLIQGESGTGKEMIANAIHATSPRQKMPYIKVNCAIFPPQLLASELFGHVKGAFTGAIRDRQGRFEMAHNGTLFLDEVAEMTAEMQLQLLRVLQEGTFERIGESLTRKVNVRIIAATNKNLQKAIKLRQFREDLYYRLNVIPIHVPPLRERPDDIPPLVQFFLKKFSLLYNKSIEEIEDQALDACLKYHWPGNVRELENNLEYAFARSQQDHILRFKKLPPHLRETAEPAMAAALATTPASPHPELITVMQQHRWNHSRAARALGISRTTLWRRLKNAGISQQI